MKIKSTSYFRTVFKKTKSMNTAIVRKYEVKRKKKGTPISKKK